MQVLRYQQRYGGVSAVDCSTRSNPSQLHKFRHSRAGWPGDNVYMLDETMVKDR